MPTHTAEDLHAAFRHYWETGAVGEDWDAWSDLFTPDAHYVEHILGDKHGREEIRAWIKPIMAEYGELYTAYEWHSVDSDADRIVVYMQNRRDDPGGGAPIDFPGITVLEVAGDGQFRREEDFWSLPEATRAMRRYQEACAVHDPEHPAKRTRLHWGPGPAWTRGATSWFARPGA